jgi:hypothetical protein
MYLSIATRLPPSSLGTRIANLVAAMVDSAKRPTGNVYRFSRSHLPASIADEMLATTQTESVTWTPVRADHFELQKREAREKVRLQHTSERC